MHITDRELALATIGVAAISTVAAWVSTWSANRNQRRLAHQERISDRQIDTYLDLLSWAEGTREAIHRQDINILGIVDVLKLPDELRLRTEAFASDVVRQRVREFQDAWFEVHTISRNDEKRLRAAFWNGADLQERSQSLMAAFPEYRAATGASDRVRGAVRAELVDQSSRRPFPLKTKRTLPDPDPL